MRFPTLLLAFIFFNVASGQAPPVTNVSSGEGFFHLDEALANVSPGDTLLLAPIAFSGRLYLEQSVHIMGSPQGGTLLDIRGAAGYGIRLNASHISLSDLTIISNADHMEYAIHSEPGISGIGLSRLTVLNNPVTGIDLNGLTEEAENRVESCRVFGSSAGFGLALSSCRGVAIEDFASGGNGFGDIGILESAYTDQRTGGLEFGGELQLAGPNSDGLGGVVVQSDSTVVSAGVGPEFDIHMKAGLVHRLSAMSNYDGASLGYVLSHSAAIGPSIEQLTGLPGVADLVCKNIENSRWELYPGLKLIDALDMASSGDTIQVMAAGFYDEDLVEFTKPITLLGSNAGISASSPIRSDEAIFSGGMRIAAHDVVLDGVRIQVGETVEVGLELASNATGCVVRNSVIRSLSDGPGQGGVGILNAGDGAFFQVALKNWMSGAVTSEGSLSFHHVAFYNNGTAVALDSPLESATLRADSCTFLNAGGDAATVVQSNGLDSLILRDCSGTGHRHVLNFQTPCWFLIENNDFSLSEEQVVGLETPQLIALCEANSFEMPSINIVSCTDPAALNYEPCATINSDCRYGGCVDPQACNFNNTANVDDGSCEYSSCAGCQIATACNYDPEALYESDNCEFLSCRGCTDSEAFNYDVDATYDDGSCLFFGCTDPDAENFDPLANQDNGACQFEGCTDNAACNFDPQANFDVGSCEYTSCAGCKDPRACNFDATATLAGACDYLSCRGCTNAVAENFDETASIDDGSCIVPGCVNQAALNYNPEANSDDGSCLIGGCTDAAACNFSPGADVDDGSCESTSCAGCAIEGFCNYDPDVTLHDGSLCDYLSCCGDPAADNYDPAILPALTYGCSYGSSAGMVFLSDCQVPIACNYLEEGACEFDSCAGCQNPEACNYDETATLPTTTCVFPEDQFGADDVDCNGQCLDDADGDGVCDAQEIAGCTLAYACNFNPLATDDDGSCESTSCAGCTDNQACNYSAAATVLDDTCEYESCLGCTDSQACNFNPEALFDAGCEYAEDVFGNPHVNCSGTCLNDQDGDGVCDEEEVSGCTNPAACNYDPTATDLDGNCEFLSCVGCMDASACNYAPTATQPSGDCDFEVCAGCTDPLACNFDEDATAEGACQYPASPLLDCAGACVNDEDGDGVCDALEVLGCTNELACNFSPEATEEDGSCDTSSCAGCTNPGACNYMPDATINDLSCEYESCQGCTDEQACNYAPSAEEDDGTCIYPLDIHNNTLLDCFGICLNDADGDGVCDEDEVGGCTDPGACNYNADAEFDNGDCESTSCAGCTNPEACNYNPYASQDDGSCTTPLTLFGSNIYDCAGGCANDADGDGVCDELEVLGCTDEMACNYEGSATESDGSCNYPDFGYGCDGECLSDQDGDGICDVLEILGCTESGACNYVLVATENDGSCFYPVDVYGIPYVDCSGACLNDADGDGICDEEEEGCVGDLNGDGIRSASDLLILLTEFGCLEGCAQGDLNGDDKVTADDILTFLTVFETVCD